MKRKNPSPTLHTEQIAIIQQSFEHMLPEIHNAAALFYTRLFEQDPTLRTLFRSDPGDQKEKFVEMLTVIVRNLHRMEQITPTIRAMGKRHEQYGVRPENYQTVADALLWAIERQLAPEFPAEKLPALCFAWDVCIRTINNLMQTNWKQTISTEPKSEH